MRRRRAFSLVELLVVIGIISLLIAILMPALRKAREHAYAIECANNLRQIAAGLRMYMNQFNNWLPHDIDPWIGDVTVSPFVGMCWTNAYLYTMVRDDEFDHKWDTFAGTTTQERLAVKERYQRLAPALGCPKDGWWDWTYPGRKNSSYGHPYWTWQYSGYKPVHKPLQNGTFVAATKFAWVKRPAESVWLTETMAHGGWLVIDSNDLLANCYRADYIAFDWGTTTIWQHPGGQITTASSTRQWRGQLNYLFFDGHVEARHLPPYDFGGTNPKPGQLVSYASFVN